MGSQVDRTIIASVAHRVRAGRLFAAACIVLALDLGGCAARSKAPEVFWPDPPDKPRIKYLRSLQSRDDVAGASFREMMVGKDAVPALYQPLGLALSEDRQRLYVVDRVWNSVFIFDFKTSAVRTIGDQERYPLSL